MVTRKFGQKLRLLRERHNVTQRELAEKLGYSAYAYVYLVESGRRKPSLDMIMKVSKLFDVSTDMLLDDERELE